MNGKTITMNIFVLGHTPKDCALYHTDKHVVKMILESAQMLCTAINESGGIAPYRSTHINHPCNIWARTSIQNWCWLKNLTYSLNEEYKFRYGDKEHKSWLAIKDLPLPNLPDIGFTPFAQAMPDQYKDPTNPVKAYREYYKNEKQHLFSWKKRNTPGWITI
jgi:hypothetical protein